MVIQTKRLRICPAAENQMEALIIAETDRCFRETLVKRAGKEHDHGV